MLKKVYGCVLALISILCVATPALAQARFATGEAGLPAWVNEVGARRGPKSRKVFSANSYGAAGDGVTSSTSATQKAIDACAKAGGVVTFKPGKYVTGALFLKGNVHLRIDQGVTLVGSQTDVVRDSTNLHQVIGFRKALSQAGAISRSRKQSHRGKTDGGKL